jgi:hypothetical protein
MKLSNSNRPRFFVENDIMKSGGFEKSERPWIHDEP